MSIYATFWALKFPSEGNHFTGCGWTEVLAQSVPAHIGAEGDDQYGSFLPPRKGSIKHQTRAVVFVRCDAEKGTSRSAQEYTDPLLVLSGKAYYAMSFRCLHDAICDALRGGRARVVLELHTANGVEIAFDDGSRKTVSSSSNKLRDR